VRVAELSVGYNRTSSHHERDVGEKLFFLEKKDTVLNRANELGRNFREM
jgi:hypothetical protein